MVSSSSGFWQWAGWFRLWGPVWGPQWEPCLCLAEVLQGLGQSVVCVVFGIRWVSSGGASAPSVALR